MTATSCILGGILLTAMGVIAGAFGAHALQKQLTPHLLGVFEVAVRYQLYHAFALILFGLWLERHPVSLLPAYGFLLGTLLFSGSLYALALTGISKLGMITPLGGLTLILAWVYWGYLVWTLK